MCAHGVVNSGAVIHRPVVYAVGAIGGNIPAHKAVAGALNVGVIIKCDSVWISIPLRGGGRVYETARARVIGNDIFICVPLRNKDDIAVLAGNLLARCVVDGGAVVNRPVVHAVGATCLHVPAHKGVAGAGDVASVQKVEGGIVDMVRLCRVRRGDELSSVRVVGYSVRVMRPLSLKGDTAVPADRKSIARRKRGGSPTCAIFARGADEHPLVKRPAVADELSVAKEGVSVLDSVGVINGHGGAC